MKRPAETQHQREFTWQILVPLVLVVLGVLVVTILSIIFFDREPAIGEKWAPIAVILMILPWLVIGLFFLALLILLSVGIKKIHGVIPLYLGLFSIRTNQIGTILQKSANQLSVPFIQVGTVIAGLDRLFRFTCSRKGKIKE